MREGGSKEEKQRAKVLHSQRLKVPFCPLWVPLPVTHHPRFLTTAKGLLQIVVQGVLSWGYLGESPSGSRKKSLSAPKSSIQLSKL